MGLLNKVLSKSSANGRSRSSELSRSCTLMNRPQPESTYLALEKSGLPVGAALNELTVSKAAKVNTTSDDVFDGHNHQLAEDKQQAHEVKEPASHLNTGIANGAEKDTVVLPSTNLKLSTRVSGSRRLAGFATLFRSRQFQRRRPNLNHLNPHRQHEVNGVSDDIDQGSKDATKSANQDDQEIIPYIPQGGCNLSEATDDIRKVSDKTDHSQNSNTTSTTVYRRPSKRSSMPIALVDQGAGHQNPFDDVWRTSHSDTSSSNPFINRSKTLTHSTSQLSSSYGDPSNPFSSHPRHIIDISSSTQSSSLCPSISGTKHWPTPVDRRMAAISFNELASDMYLEPLALGGSDESRTPLDGNHIASGTTNGGGEKLFRRRDRFFGRIRNMRSTLHMKAEPPDPQGQTLRRKTFSGLSSRPCLMTSLSGKSLESLARLGGYSLLTLPGDFAPATLSLPVCFVAIINYLRCFAPTVRNIFFDAGDINTAAQTYDYFAAQVLSAKKEQDKIQTTMRSGKMPDFLVGDPDLDSKGKLSAQILGVGWTFKVLLSGLPGGILGSMKLYEILVNISYGRMSKGPSKRVGSRLVGLSSENYVKVRAISLAIVALTSSMQLNLICAVLGLCSLLLHETERISELERLGIRAVLPPSLIGSGMLNVERVGEFLAPLLTDCDRNDNPDTFQAIQHEIESRRIASLLIENWRNVSRQLRLWEHRGVEARASMDSWARTVSESSEIET